MRDDLIRRQEMGEAIDRIKLDLKHETFYSFYQKALMALNEVPTVDAVPVVRCRDCKHFDLDHWETINGIPLIVAHEICTFWGGGCKTDAGGYCFKGKRREEDAVE